MRHTELFSQYPSYSLVLRKPQKQAQRAPAATQKCMDISAQLSPEESLKCSNQLIRPFTTTVKIANRIYLPSLSHTPYKTVAIPLLCTQCCNHRPERIIMLVRSSVCKLRLARASSKQKSRFTQTMSSPFCQFNSPCFLCDEDSRVKKSSRRATEGTCGQDS